MSSDNGNDETSVVSPPPGSFEGLQLTVYDIDANREDLIARGIDVSETFSRHHRWSSTTAEHWDGRVSGPAPSMLPTAPSWPSTIRRETDGYCRRSGRTFPADERSE